MVRKLMVDDFRAILRYWKGIGLTSIIILLVSAIFFSLNLPVVSDLMIVPMIIMLFTFILSLPITVLVHYYRNLYGSEAYLTHSLPVRGRELYVAKTLSAFICLLADVILGMAALSIIEMAMAKRGGESVLEPFRVLFTQFGLLEHRWSYVGIIIAYTLFTIFMMITQFAFAISKGSEARFHRLGLGGPVIVYLVTYFVQQAASLIGMVSLPIGVRFINQNTDELQGFEIVMESSWTSFRDSLSGNLGTTFTLGLGFALLLLLLGVLYVFFTIRSIERHTSLR